MFKYIQGSVLGVLFSDILLVKQFSDSVTFANYELWNVETKDRNVTTLVGMQSGMIVCRCEIRMNAEVKFVKG